MRGIIELGWVEWQEMIVNSGEMIVDCDEMIVDCDEMVVAMDGAL